jgi:hypothetical protein
MPSVGNELNHTIDGLTVRGGLALEGNGGAATYLSREVAAKLARENAANRAMGYYAETVPCNAAGAASVSISQRVYGVAIGLLAGDVVSNLIVACNVINNTATLTKLGLANSSGTMLAQSAEVSSTFGTTGKKVIAMAAPYTVTADGLYYAVFLNVASTGASLFRANGGGNAFQAVTGFSALNVNQDSQSDLPANGAALTLAATANAFGYWIAVS